MWVWTTVEIVPRTAAADGKFVSESVCWNRAGCRVHSLTHLLTHSVVVSPSSQSRGTASRGSSQRMTAVAGHSTTAQLAQDRLTGLAIVALLGVIGMYFLFLLLRLVANTVTAVQLQHTAQRRRVGEYL